MHTPDGFITSPICVLMLAASVFVIYLSYRARSQWLNAATLSKMALLSGLIFLLQMLNFPIAWGTSGHFLGAALASVMVGPYAAMVVLVSVLGVQAAVFGDGGMMSIGVNVFNMAIVGVWAAHYVHKWAKARMDSNYSFLLSSWVSVIAASTSASLLLALGGHAAPFAIFAGMLSAHALIGIGEGLVGLVMLNVLAQRAAAPAFSLSTSASYLAIAVILCALALPLASSSPDGMDSVALNLGFYSAATTIWTAPLPDYAIEGLPSTLSNLIVAALGASLCFGSMAALGMKMRLNQTKAC